MDLYNSVALAVAYGSYYIYGCAPDEAEAEQPDYKTVHNDCTIICAHIG